jgi:predicted metallopeptidase
MVADTEVRSMTPTTDAIADRLPLILRWGEPADPLPLNIVRGSKVSGFLAAPPWIPTGQTEEPFDFCAHVRRLCDDISFRCPELAHVRTNQVLFAFTQARNRRAHGLQARVTPLRFHGGRLLRRHRGVSYQVQRIVVGDADMLYLMTFCLPRFLNQPFDDKLVTIFHELYHISPAFDGDLRRHEGRCQFHSRSRRGYDEAMVQLARAYLGSGPDPDLHAFLRLDFAQLQARHGSVVGVSIPRPKLVPLLGEAACTDS